VPQVKTQDFFPASVLAVQNAQLQEALKRAGTGFDGARQEAIAEVGNDVWEEWREEARQIKVHTLEHLDYYLELLTENVERAGGLVHFAKDAAQANAIVAELATSRDVRVAVKSKSMVSEELNLNEVLEQNGVDVYETDLGEYIIQLAEEPPSHLVAPALHKTKEQVSQLFHEKLGVPLTDDIEEMARVARETLRDKFMQADLGISGANFLVAETGSSIIVTNEGNGDLTQCLPKVHIVIASLEKVVPTLEDVNVILRVLARSATGQECSTYTAFSTGPRRPGDPDGPEQYHVILLDNGRSNMLGGEFQEALRCIRCGACMNHCPVYHAVGGHAYGWVYPGPIGAVLTPAFIGIEQAAHLPNASSFCGRCEAVCPMRIPLPKMMRHWREREFERHLTPRAARWGLGIWAFFARRPWLYHAATALAGPALRLMAGGRGRIRRLPLGGGWTDYRDFPAPEGRTFHQLWAQRRKEREP